MRKETERCYNLPKRSQRPVQSSHLKWCLSVGWHRSSLHVQMPLWELLQAEHWLMTLKEEFGSGWEDPLSFRTWNHQASLKARRQALKAMDLKGWRMPQSQQHRWCEASLECCPLGYGRVLMGILPGQVLSPVTRTLVQALFTFLLTAEGLGGLGHNFFYVTHFCCVPQEEGWVWGRGPREGQRKGGGKCSFWFYPANLTVTHSLTCAGWKPGSTAPSLPKELWTTHLAMQRWLQAPSAFIINHWDRKDYESPPAESLESSVCGHILLPESDFLLYFMAQGLRGQTQRSCSLGSILKSWDSFLDLILTARPS